MAERLTDVPYGKRWRIWNFDATRSGVSGPETLPPDGAPQRGLRATEENPVEVMAVEEAEAMLQRASAYLEEQEAEIASLQQECREAQASEIAAIERARNHQAALEAIQGEVYLWRLGESPLKRPEASDEA